MMKTKKFMLTIFDDDRFVAAICTEKRKQIIFVGKIL